MAEILVYLAGGAALILAWYVFFVRYNRERAVEVLHWIEAALAGHGHVIGMRWFAPSRFIVPLRLNTHVFQHASVTVEITPRELPFRWFLNWLRKRPETVTFEADLDCPPGFNLAVRNHRWWGRTNKKLPSDPNRWIFDQTAPLLLTSRQGWKGNTPPILNALFSCRDKEFLKLLFRRSSPHFTATVALTAVTPSTDAQNFFDVLLEVASGASTSRL